MATEQDGWVGIKVRHTDGRDGSIVGQYAGFLHLGLSIRCSDGTDARVQLNANGRDTGEAGWEWWCSNFSNGPCWLPLGDQPAR